MRVREARYVNAALTPIVWSGQKPLFELTFHCGGRPFITAVRARNSEAAASEGRIELASQCPDFDHECARLVRVVQTQ